MSAFLDRLGFKKFSQLYYLCVQLILVMGAGAAMPVVLPGKAPNDQAIIILAVTGVVLMFYELFLLAALGYFVKRETGWKKAAAGAMMALPLWLLYAVITRNFMPLL